MPETAELPTGARVRLVHDGRTHEIGNAAGSWSMRLELEQLGAGELIGIGSVATALDAPHDGVVAEVIVSGRVDGEGMARLVLTPLASGSLVTVTLVARVRGGRADAQDPVLDAVLEVHGLPV